MTHKIPLYENDQCIGRVSYIDNLDHWDGHNYTNGSTGRHSGIGKTRSGKFFLVSGTQWQGERDSANVISEAEARELVLSANNDALFGALFGESPPTLD